MRIRLSLRAYAIVMAMPAIHGINWMLARLTYDPWRFPGRKANLEKETEVQKFRITLGAMLAGLVLLGTQVMPSSAMAQDKSKVVLQVSDNDPAKWNLALNNASNLQKDVGKDNIEIQIVAYGPGINMLKAESEVGNRVQEAKDAGIKTVACMNTMRKANLKQDDMLPSIGFVPSGVVELMKKQEQGYAYLRP